MHCVLMLLLLLRNGELGFESVFFVAAVNGKDR
jgi:hypothetical protein